MHKLAALALTAAVGVAGMGYAHTDVDARLAGLAYPIPATPTAAVRANAASLCIAAILEMLNPFSQRGTERGVDQGGA